MSCYFCMIIYTSVCLITYSCVDMCRHTNQYRSHDWPNHIVTYCFTYIIDHSFDYTFKMFLWNSQWFYHNHVKSVQSHAILVHIWNFLMLKIIMFVNLYDHMSYMCWIFLVLLYHMFIVYCSSCGTILGLMPTTSHPKAIGGLCYGTIANHINW